MTYGKEEDIKVGLKYFTLEDMKEALKDPLPGIFDNKSWTFWNIIFFDEVPAMPRRFNL